VLMWWSIKSRVIRRRRSMGSMEVMAGCDLRDMDIIMAIRDMGLGVEAEVLMEAGVRAVVIVIRVVEMVLLNAWTHAMILAFGRFIAGMISGRYH
jgi:hypothetical protein